MVKDDILLEELEKEVKKQTEQVQEKSKTTSKATSKKSSTATKSKAAVKKDETSSSTKSTTKKAATSSSAKSTTKKATTSSSTKPTTKKATTSSSAKSTTKKATTSSSAKSTARKATTSSSTKSTKTKTTSNSKSSPKKNSPTPSPETTEKAEITLEELQPKASQTEKIIEAPVTTAVALKEKEIEETVPTDILEETAPTQSQKQFEPVQVSRYPKKLNIFLISVCILLAIILVSFVCFTLINANSTTIVHGVYVHRFNVSKLSKEEALTSVNNSISANIPEEIKLIYKDFETTIPTADLNITFDSNSAVNEAYSIGRTGNLLDNDIKILQTMLSNIHIEPKMTFDEEVLKTKLQEISSKLPDCLIESSYYLEDDKLILTKGRTGSVVDVDKTLSTIKTHLQNLELENGIEISTFEQSPTPLDVDKIHTELYVEPKDAYFTQNPYSLFPSENGIDFAITVDEVKNMLNEEKEEYEIPLKILPPNVTTNMLGREAFPDLLSTFSTSYSTRDKDRTTNLILAANKINGMVLMPGETFSYNKVVGERTIAAGYREAPIYVSGEVVDGVGGGICQITTTLYNAVVYANLEILERTNHQFVPSYAAASRDATVVYGAIDFKFKNNRNYPIKLIASVSNGTANFQILGLKTDQDYKVEITNRVTSTTATSIYSEAYKILKQNGKVVGTYLLSKDVYKKH